jgi:hypothetical protein
LVVRRGWLEAVSKRSTDRKCRVPLPSWSHRRLFRQNPRHTRPHTGCHVWPGFRDIRVSHHICGQRVLDRSTGHGLRSSMRRPWRLRYSVPIRDRTAARAIWLSDDSSKHGNRLIRFDCTIRAAGRTDWSFLKTRLFWVYSASNLAMGLGYFFPSLYLPSYATAHGISST